MITIVVARSFLPDSVMRFYTVPIMFWACCNCCWSSCSLTLFSWSMLVGVGMGSQALASKGLVPVKRQNIKVSSIVNVTAAISLPAGLLMCVPPYIECYRYKEVVFRGGLEPHGSRRLILHRYC